MTIKLHMDVHVRQAVTQGLRLRGVDVVTSQEDGTITVDDDILLDRATALGRALFTQDEDLLAEATRRQRSDIPFAGVVFAPQVNVTVGQCVRDLELIAKACEPVDLADRVMYIPFP